MKTVFLGGTCNNSTWRTIFEKELLINYFNPVVDDWNEDAQKAELKWRKESDFALYVITPQMKGVYSIAEVVDDSNKQPEKTLFCVLNDYDRESFDNEEIKSLEAVKFLVRKNGAKVFESLPETINYLNSYA